jgi:hypothetical protein
VSDISGLPARIPCSQAQLKALKIERRAFRSVVGPQFFSSIHRVRWMGLSNDTVTYPECSANISPNHRRFRCVSGLRWLSDQRRNASIMSAARALICSGS